MIAGKTSALALLKAVAPEQTHSSYSLELKSCENVERITALANLIENTAKTFYPSLSLPHHVLQTPALRDTENSYDFVNMGAKDFLFGIVLLTSDTMYIGVVNEDSLNIKAPLDTTAIFESVLILTKIAIQNPFLTPIGTSLVSNNLLLAFPLYVQNLAISSPHTNRVDAVRAQAFHCFLTKLLNNFSKNESYSLDLIIADDIFAKDNSLVNYAGMRVEQLDNHPDYWVMNDNYGNPIEKRRDSNTILVLDNLPIEIVRKFENLLSAKRFVKMNKETLKEVSLQFDIAGACAYKKHYLSKNRLFSMNAEGCIFSASEKAIARIESKYAKDFYLDICKTIDISKDTFQIPHTHGLILPKFLHQAKKGGYLITKSENMANTKLPALLAVSLDSKSNKWSEIDSSKSQIALSFLLDNVLINVPIKTFTFPSNEIDQLFALRDDVKTWRYVNLPDKATQLIMEKLATIPNIATDILLYLNVNAKQKERILHGKIVYTSNSDPSKAEFLEQDIFELRITEEVFAGLFHTEVEDHTGVFKRVINLTPFHAIYPSLLPINCVLQIPYALTEAESPERKKTIGGMLLKCIYFDSIGNFLGSSLSSMEIS